MNIADRKLLCSTGALITSKNNRNHHLLAEIAPKLHCDGFEFMMYQSWYDTWEQISSDLAEMSLSFPVFHVEKCVGQGLSRNEEGDNEQAQKLFEINCNVAQRIGAQKLVMHLWDGIPSDSNIENNIEQYAYLNETAKNYGLLLTIENVVCNKEDPLLHFKALKKRYPDIAFTFDVKFAQFHEQLDLALSDEYRWLWAGAVRHLHISDYAGGYKEWDRLKSLHPGEGRIDYEKLFENLKRSNYAETVTIESTSVLPDGSINYDKLNDSLDYLRNLMV